MSKGYESFEAWLEWAETLGYEPSVCFLTGKFQGNRRLLLIWKREAGILSGRVEIKGIGSDLSAALSDALQKFPSVEEVEGEPREFTPEITKPTLRIASGGSK